jgi:pimeloyl-ACP methyl ester carboxylesterase
VLLCNGLGTSAWAWPAFLDADCGVRVVSWNHRGTGGSDRPDDVERVGIEEFAEDGLSVMDHFGIDRAVLIGWSMGVNTAFEIAVLHPERVSGLFAVAGVPGDTFATMLGPLRLPRAAAKAVAVNVARVLKYGGRLVTPVSTRLPVGRRAIDVISHSGFMLPSPIRSWPAARSRRSSRRRSSGTSTSRCTPRATAACD